MNSSPKEAWDRYWKDGRGAACQSDDEGLYEGAIGEYWQQLFSGLPGSSRVVDLACGNGALAGAAARAGASLTMYCVDAAAIRPEFRAAPATHTQARFYPTTPIERLPFAADMFDGCVSQYGAEYGDLQACASEIARVLKPGAWLRWICHWREGDIARDADDEARRAALLEQLQLPGRIARLIEHQVRQGRYIADSHRKTWHLPEARRVKQGLAEGFRIARATPQNANGNLGLFLHNLAHLYQHREQYPVDQALARMRECGDELQRHRERLEALVAAALTPERLDGLRTWLGSAGLPMTDARELRSGDGARCLGMEIRAGADPAG